MEEIRILSPTAILGYGFPEESFRNGLEADPNVIGIDAGSTDPGPYYLGEGKSFVERNLVKRDLELIIPQAIKRKITVIIGSAGGNGTRIQVTWCLSIIREIVKKYKLHPKIAIIYSDIDKNLVKHKLRKRKIKSLPFVPELTEEIINSTTGIVAQMGVEPILKALEKNVDIIVAGRCYDPAIFAALPVKYGFDIGLAIHLGKIIECAAIATTPGSGKDCVLGILRKDSFILKPLNNNRKFTVDSVSAHTLYEKSDPSFLPGPGGYLDLSNTVFKQINSSSVEVKGSKFVSSEQYTLKIEGATFLGYRTISICGIRDKIMIRQLDSILNDIKKDVKRIFKFDYYLEFRVYGKNGVMLFSEPDKNIIADEVGIIIEAIASTQEYADTLCGFTRSTFLHYGYPGRISTAGNLAFPFSPSDIPIGKVFKFSIYHLMEVDNPIDLFPIKILKW